MVRFSVYIRFPEYPSEFEVQRELIHRLQRLNLDFDGVDVCGEVSMTWHVTGASGVRRRNGCRLDVVVFADRDAVCIVEVKRDATHRHNTTRQLEQYRAVTGLPVLLCAGPEEIGRTVIDVRNYLRSYGEKEAGGYRSEPGRGL